ncbi:MAG: hypothetical protein C3F18_07185 [Nitrosomonadales bacterium]|nr:MAG: hypothetical protein C3F18_07185 [Nitrosomonadales bacterium]
MPQKEGAAMHKGSGASTPKKLLVHFVMLTIGILLVSFSLWLVYLTYFKVAHRTGETLAKKAVSRLDMIYEPFHGADESVLAGSKSKSWCLKCHEDLSHSKSKEVRGMLNAHSFFMACEVCHIAPREGERFEYKWIQRGTSIPLAELKGPPGEYGGTIIPFKIEKGISRRLDENPEALQLLDESATHENDEDLQKRKMRLNTDIHKEFSPKPIFCDECHRENGPLDFSQLMYSPQRAQLLTFGEGANVIKQYKDFYLPSLMRNARRER